VLHGSSHTSFLTSGFATEVASETPRPDPASRAPDQVFPSNGRSDSDPRWAKGRTTVFESLLAELTERVCSDIHQLLRQFARAQHCGYWGGSGESRSAYAGRWSKWSPPQTPLTRSEFKLVVKHTVFVAAPDLHVAVVYHRLHRFVAGENLSGEAGDTVPLGDAG
jgi:hypothetical protein